MIQSKWIKTVVKYPNSYSVLLPFENMQQWVWLKSLTKQNLLPCIRNIITLYQQYVLGDIIL